MIMLMLFEMMVMVIMVTNLSAGGTTKSTSSPAAVETARAAAQGEVASPTTAEFWATTGWHLVPEQLASATRVWVCACRYTSS